MTSELCTAAASVQALLSQVSNLLLIRQQGSKWSYCEYRFPCSYQLSRRLGITHVAECVVLARFVNRISTFWLALTCQPLNVGLQPQSKIGSTCNIARMHNCCDSTFPFNLVELHIRTAHVTSSVCNFTVSKLGTSITMAAECKRYAMLYLRPQACLETCIFKQVTFAHSMLSTHITTTQGTGDSEAQQLSACMSQPKAHKVQLYFNTIM